MLLPSSTRTRRVAVAFESRIVDERIRCFGFGGEQDFLDRADRLGEITDNERVSGGVRLFPLLFPVARGKRQRSRAGAAVPFASSREKTTSDRSSAQRPLLAVRLRNHAKECWRAACCCSARCADYSGCRRIRRCNVRRTVTSAIASSRRDSRDAPGIYLVTIATVEARARTIATYGVATIGNGEVES